MADQRCVLDEEYKSPSTMNASTAGAGSECNSRSTACITPSFRLLFTPVWAALSSRIERWGVRTGL